MKLFMIRLGYLCKRIFYVLMCVFILQGSLLFTIDSLHFGSIIIYNPFYHIPKGLPNWLYYLEYFSMVFALGIVYLYCRISYLSRLKQKLAVDRRRKEKIYSDYIISMLYNEDLITNQDIQQEVDKMTGVIHKDRSRVLLIDVLRRILWQTKGKIVKRIMIVVRKLDYKYLLYCYLHSPYQNHKIRALCAISDFKLPGNDRYILKLIKRTNFKSLHTNALIALSKVNFHDNILKIMDMNVKLTLWDINIILDAIVKTNDRHIPYRQLLESKNQSIVLLGVMLVRIHKRDEFKPIMMQLMDHDDDWIHEEALMAVCLFASEDVDYEMLLSMYPKSTEMARIAILDVISSYRNKEKSISFLKNSVFKDTVKCKIKALEILLNVDINTVIDLRQSNNVLARYACGQVLDFSI